MDRDNLLLIALALLCLAGVVLGVGGVTLLKRDRSGRGDDTDVPAAAENGSDER